MTFLSTLLKCVISRARDSAQTNRTVSRLFPISVHFAMFLKNWFILLPMPDGTGNAKRT